MSFTLTLPTMRSPSASTQGNIRPSSRAWSMSLTRLACVEVVKNSSARRGSQRRRWSRLRVYACARASASSGASGRSTTPPPSSAVPVTGRLPRGADSYERPPHDAAGPCGREAGEVAYGRPPRGVRPGGRSWGGRPADDVGDRREPVEADAAGELPVDAGGPEGAAVDPARIALDQGGAGQQPFPDVVHVLDAAYGHQREPVADAGAQPPQDLQRTGLERAAGQPAGGAVVRDRG